MENTNITGCTDNQYSVLMSVYAKENPEYLRLSVASMLNQTTPTDDFVLMSDGPLTDDLNQTIADLQRKYGTCLRVIRLPQNQGLAAALRTGVTECRHELIARMDSDDIALPDRCEKQLRAYHSDPSLCLLSGTIAEFRSDPEEIENYRKLPEEHDAILKFARKRNPMNHMAVMFRKSKVIAAGNYRSIGLFEDYDLWVRMLIQGCVAANLSDVLVKARIGNGMIGRRGGITYAKNCVSLQKSFYRAGFISLPVAVENSIIRGSISLLPTCLRERFYNKALRKKPDKERNLNDR